VKIAGHNWKWSKQLGRRSGLPPFIVVHHQAGTGSTAGIHASHLSRGWRGIGYHYHVRLDGSIHRGRPEWAYGAHAPGANDSIGICFEGNYETQRDMPAAQLAAGRELMADLQRRYPKAKVRGHGDFVPTACPGRYFPLNELLKGGSVALPLVDPGKRALLKERMLWYALRNDLSLKDVAGKLSIVARDGTPSNGWGEPARKLAWRVSGHLPGFKQSTQPSAALMRALK